MPQTFTIDMLPIGISLDHAFEGDSVAVLSKEFLSSEDGNDFIDRLDGLANCYRTVFEPHGMPRSLVDNFLAIVTKERNVTAYCNEVSLVATARKKHRPFKKGEAVFKSDIVDVEEGICSKPVASYCSSDSGRGSSLVRPSADLMRSS